MTRAWQAADIRIDKIGHASVSQPDTRERTLGTEDTLWLFEEDIAHAPIVTLHEFGPLCLHAVRDLYKEQYL